MSDLNIDPKLVDAVARAIYEALGDSARRRPWNVLTLKQREPMLCEAKAAIRAVFDELDLTIYDNNGHNRCYRYISKWIWKT